MNDNDKPARMPHWEPQTRFKVWRKGEPATTARRERTDDESKRTAAIAARSRIPADHPDIPF